MSPAEDTLYLGRARTVFLKEILMFEGDFRAFPRTPYQTAKFRAFTLATISAVFGKNKYYRLS